MRDLILSPEEVAALRELSADVTDDPYGSDFDAYDRRLAAHPLPARLADFAREFGDRIGSAGALRIRGVPIPQDLPPTPAVPYFEVRSRTGTEAMLLAISRLAGQVVGLKAWRGGDRVHNIYPVPADAGTQKASNSVRLAMHSELAFRPERAHALAILCLRGGTCAPSTGFCDLLKLWGRLDAGTRARLSEPAFGFAKPPPQDGVFAPSAIAMVRGAAWHFQYDSGVRGASAAHEQSLRTLGAAIEREAVEVTLAPGDLILIDNLHMVHGRTPFNPSYEGGDRWLQRCIIHSPAIH